VQTIRIQLREQGQETVELRYLLPQQQHYESRPLPLTGIRDVLQQGEQEYYVLLPNIPRIGQQLFLWLDGDGRWLSRGLAKQRGEGLVIAINTGEKLAHLPWEALHDGQDFLVKRGVVPLRWVVEGEIEELPIERRPLRVLFMATDPEGITPKLAFEQEEAKILHDTQEQPIELQVEESGCIGELGKVWSRHIHTFDVFHLTGHASITDKTPHFITETEIGEPQNTTAVELGQVLRYRFPKLVFLSGCRTGEAPEQGAVPSMAEALIEQGAISVLSWGRPVRDTTATATAAHLYSQLAAGYQLAEALASTYQHLWQQKVPDWHLLRLYVRGKCPGAFVEPQGDIPWQPPTPAYQQFLDEQTQQVRVATPGEFVGRRRVLQRCLKALRTPNYLGVLIHGLGGVGKSTVTARLLERLVGYDRIVIYRQLDEDKLFKVLAEQCTSESGHEILNGKLPLMQRLTKFLQEGLNHREQRLIFVLDDFEANLEISPTGALLKPGVVEVVMALWKAVQNSQLPHRVIITSRYDFTLPELDHRLNRQPLAALQSADLDKKYQRLSAFNGSLAIDGELQQQGKKAADGNPRLLEWIDQILSASTQGELEVGEILRKVAAKAAEFRENILAEELLKRQHPGLRKMLGRLLVYEVPVPLAAVAPICEGISEWENHLERAARLGLSEVTLSYGDGGPRLYRVPHILSPLLECPQGEELYQQGTEILYRLWWGKTSTTEAQKLEIHRLALLGKQGKIAAEVASALANRLWQQSRFREAVHLCQSTLEVTEDYRVLKEMAYCQHQLGDVEQVIEYYQQALNLCPPEDEREKAFIYHNLGMFYANRGEVESAISLFQQSLELWERIGDVRGKAATLHCLGILSANRGEVESAISLFLQSLELKERIGDVQGKAATLHQLGILYANRGEVESAISLYQQSLELDERIGDVQGKAATLHQLGILYANRGEVESAISLFHQSLELWERIGNVQGKAATLHQLGSLYANRGEVESAISLFHQSLELTERVGDVQGKAATLHELGRIYANRGEVESAISLYQQSLELWERIGNVQGKAATLHELGRIYANRGEVESAISLFQQSLEIKEHIGNVQGKAMTLWWLGGLAAQQGEHIKAIAYLQPALEILQRIKSPYAEQVGVLLEGVQQQAGGQPFE